MRRPTYDIQVVRQEPNLVGECPIWHAEERALYWVDTRGAAIQRLKQSGEVDVWPMPEKVGSIVFRERGGLIAAMQNGFCEVDPELGTVKPIIDPEPDRPANRMNDGKCDRRGRFWCGSRDATDDNPGGSLYRLDPDFSCHTMDTGFICSNGMAFSPDDRTLVFADSFGEGAYAYDLDIDAGTVSNRRLFLSTRHTPWLIDGATFDAEGYYWCALVFDWSIGRFDPLGRLDRLIRLPVQHPTMCNFGGDGMDVLYVTSASAFVSEEEKLQQPLAGALFAIHGLGVRGIPEPRFKG